MFLFVVAFLSTHQIVYTRPLLSILNAYLFVLVLFYPLLICISTFELHRGFWATTDLAGSLFQTRSFFKNLRSQITPKP